MGDRKRTQRTRTTKGLRDILFDELEELRSPNGDPQRAQAVANIARQIINTAKVEIEFFKSIRQEQEAGNRIMLGAMPLGTVANGDVSAAKEPATGH